MTFLRDLNTFLDARDNFSFLMTALPKIRYLHYKNQDVIFSFILITIYNVLDKSKSGYITIFGSFLPTAELRIHFRERVNRPAGLYPYTETKIILYFIVYLAYFFIFNRVLVKVTSLPQTLASKHCTASPLCSFHKKDDS